MKSNANTSGTTDPDELDVVVVGAGMAGLYAVYRFREAGLTVQAIEAAPDIGGTWFFNRYPGARCDIPSIAYAYSFSPDLAYEWEWSEKHATQPEILGYLNHVADRFNLRDHIKLETRVVAAQFDEASSRWTVVTDRGDTVRARFVVTAAGCLSIPKLPEVEGVETFGGISFHTARWPDVDVDFRSKRVAVIGTGSSGIQVIPLIAEEAAELIVFQRTPAFSLPAANRPLIEDELVMVRDLDGYREYFDTARRSWFGVPRPFPEGSALEVDDEQRDATYEAAWQEGGFTLITRYADIGSNKAANDTAAEFVRRKIRQIVKDPETAELLLPADYAIGAKRLCLDSGYYKTFNRDNVTLVDLRRTPLVAITPDGLRTSERSFEFDVIVYATGFDAITGALTSIDIRGTGGKSLKDKWHDGPRTYLGVATSGFPNLFMITGPGSPSVLSNMMVSIEQHVDWITAFIEHMDAHGIVTMEPTPAAEDAWGEHVNEFASFTIFPTAASWYTGANVPGKPRVFMPYVGGVGFYRSKCEEVVEKGYEGFELRSNATESAAAPT